jgi:hypothetical protein
LEPGISGIKNKNIIALANLLLLLLLLENVSLRVPASRLRDFSLFGVCPSNKHCPSARCAYADKAVGKDLDIFAIGAVSLIHM